MPADPDRDPAQVAAIVRDGYNKIADDYLAAMGEPIADDPRAEWSEMLLDALAPGSRVLDIGCGPGVPTAALLTSAGHHVVGIDIADRQIALARCHVPAGEFIVGDVVDARFEDGSFSAAVALFSLTHVPRIRYPELFAQLRSWLSPTGWFLASLGSSDSPGWHEEGFLGFEATSWTNHYDPSTMLDLMRGAGFAIEHNEVVTHATPFGPETWLWVLARGLP